MLDTNIVSHLMRYSLGPVAVRAREAGERNLCISVIVAAELRFGAAKNGSANLKERVEIVLQRLPIVAFDSPADEVYARIRSHLERAGRPIGANDLFIAAHACAIGATLVTANVGEFVRVPDLQVQNWIA